MFNLTTASRWRGENPAVDCCQVGDTARDQIVILAYVAPDGESDNLICALKLIIHMTKENKLGLIVVKS